MRYMLINLAPLKFSFTVQTNGLCVGRFPVVIAVAFCDRVCGLLNAPPEVRINHRMLDYVAALNGHVLAVSIFSSLVASDSLHDFHARACRIYLSEIESIFLGNVATVSDSLSSRRTGRARGIAVVRKDALLNRAMTINAADLNSCARLC